MLGLVASGVRAVTKVACEALKGSTGLARQAVETTASVSASPVAHIVGSAHMQMLNLPGMAGSVVQQSAAVPAAAVSPGGQSALGSLVLPPVGAKEGLV